MTEPGPGWVQVNAAFDRQRRPARDSARAFFEVLGTELATWRPHLVDLFWFQRKPPDLRLRFHTADDLAFRHGAAKLLDRCVAQGVLDQWHFAIYESEWRKLGSHTTMDGYHRWADADTSCWMAFDRWLARSGPMTRPAENELCGALVAPVLDALFVETVRDRDEVWDVWCNVSALAGGPDPPTSLDGAEPPMPLSEVLQTLGADLADLRIASQALSRCLAEASATGSTSTGLRATLALISQLSLQRWGLDQVPQQKLALAMASQWDPRRGLRGGFG
jgi:hypothetical protein